MMLRLQDDPLQQLQVVALNRENGSQYDPDEVLSTTVSLY